MKKKPVNKDNFIYDLLLTASLIYSAFCADGIMRIANLWDTEHELIIFVFFTFILIKTTYNLSKKIYKKIKIEKARQQGMRY